MTTPFCYLLKLPALTQHPWTSRGHYCPLIVFFFLKELRFFSQNISKSLNLVREILLISLMSVKFRRNAYLSLPRNWVPGIFLALALKVLCPKESLSSRQTGTVCHLTSKQPIIQYKWKNNPFTRLPSHPLTAWCLNHYIQTYIINVGGLFSFAFIEIEPFCTHFSTTSLIFFWLKKEKVSISEHWENKAKFYISAQLGSTSWNW